MLKTAPLLVFLVGGVMACQAREGPDPAPSSPPPTVPPAASVSVDKPLPAGCSARAWFDAAEPARGTYAHRRANTVAIIAAWSQECRWISHMADCWRGCDDLLSNMLLDAAADDAEKLKLTKWRHNRNVEGLAEGRRLEKRATELLAYARRMNGTRRAPGSATCLDRQTRDLARLATFKDDLQRELPGLPTGSDGLLTLAARMQPCLDCNDDRSRCTLTASEPELLSFRKSLADRAELVAADKASIDRFERRAADALPR